MSRELKLDGYRAIAIKTGARVGSDRETTTISTRPIQRIRSPITEVLIWSMLPEHDGFTAASRERLFSKCRELEISNCPFVTPPRRILAGEVRAHGSQDGRRRIFYGIARRSEVILIASLYRAC